MSEEVEVEPYYQREAKEFVNFIFDKGFIAADCSRESIAALENYVAFILQSRIEMAIKSHDLIKRVRRTE